MVEITRHWDDFLDDVGVVDFVGHPLDRTDTGEIRTCVCLWRLLRHFERSADVDGVSGIRNGWRLVLDM